MIENKPGAGRPSRPRSSCKRRRTATRCSGSSTSNYINATLYEKLPYNFIRDIEPIASSTRSPLVVVVNPSVPVKTVPEFIAYAKANPGKLNMASGGIGNSTHMAGELFKMMTGVENASRALSRLGAGAHRPDRPARCR